MSIPRVVLAIPSSKLSMNILRHLGVHLLKSGIRLLALFLCKFGYVRLRWLRLKYCHVPFDRRLALCNLFHRNPVPSFRIQTIFLVFYSLNLASFLLTFWALMTVWFSNVLVFGVWITNVLNGYYIRIILTRVTLLLVALQVATLLWFRFCTVKARFLFLDLYLYC